MYKIIIELSYRKNVSYFHIHFICCWLCFIFRELEVKKKSNNPVVTVTDRELSTILLFAELFLPLIMLPTRKAVIFWTFALLSPCN